MERKKVTRVLALTLTTMLCMSVFAVPVFADQPEMEVVTKTGTVVVGTGSGTTEQYAKHTYGAYKVMNKLTAVDENGEYVYKDADGNPIFQYMISDAFKDWSDPAFEIDEKTGRIYVVQDPWTGEAIEPKYALTEADGDLTYTGNSMYVSALAASLQKYCSTRGIGPIATFQDGEVNGLTHGYYLILEEDTSDDDTLIATRPILCNVDEDTVRITIKDSLVTLDKVITTEGGDIIGDEDNYSIGDTVWFDVTGAFPMYAANVDLKNVIFTWDDVMTNLNCVEDSVWIGVQVPSNGTSSSGYTELKPKTEGSTEWDYEVTFDERRGHDTITIKMNPESVVKYQDMPYRLRYAGIMNEEAVIEGDPAGVNEVTLFYSHNPNKSNDTKELTDDVEVFTYGFDFSKTDDHGLLSGATFALNRLDDVDDEGSFVELIKDAKKSTDVLEVYRPVMPGEKGLTEFDTTGK